LEHNTKPLLLHLHQQPFARPYQALRVGLSSRSLWGYVSMALFAALGRAVGSTLVVERLQCLPRSGDWDWVALYKIDGFYRAVVHYSALILWSAQISSHYFTSLHFTSFK
jgi:hypothetical protein